MSHTLEMSVTFLYKEIRVNICSNSVLNTSRFLFNAAMAAQLPHSPRNVLQLRAEMVEHDIEGDRRSRELIRDAELLLRPEGLVEGFVGADREEKGVTGEIDLWEVKDEDDEDESSS